MPPTKLIGEPHINGHKAVPYSTFHQNWQSRITKEKLATLSQEAIHDTFLGQPGKQDLRTWEQCGIGIAHQRNNTSSAFGRTFGPKSWGASGGIRTSQRDSFGDPQPQHTEKVNTFRTFQGMPSSSLRSSSSMPDLPRPGQQTIAANNMRAAPNRSVASVLRQPRRPDTPPSPSLAPSTPPMPTEDDGRGVLGVNAYRRPQNSSIAAEVMRAAPNRSIASVLRHEKAKRH